MCFGAALQPNFVLGRKSLQIGEQLHSRLVPIFLRLASSLSTSTLERHGDAALIGARPGGRDVADLGTKSSTVLPLNGGWPVSSV